MIVYEHRHHHINMHHPRRHMLREVVGLPALYHCDSRFPTHSVSVTTQSHTLIYIIYVMPSSTHSQACSWAPHTRREYWGTLRSAWTIIHCKTEVRCIRYRYYFVHVWVSTGMDDYGYL